MKIIPDSIVNPGDIVLKNTSFSIEGDRIFIGNDDSRCRDDIIVENSIAFPGLINIHDHLKYSWYKRTGQGKYANVYQWLEDLYKTFDPVFNTKNNDFGIMFQLGLYKQIFSATTTVLNHSRHSKNILKPEKQYINIVENIESELIIQPALISNVTSHSLSFGKSIQDAHNEAIKSIPQKAFMIHVAEGTDDNTKKEINILDELGVLTHHSILVHCINTDIKDIELIAKKKCSVVWCPYTSNFVIGKSADIRAMLASGINLCIGTDSSCSGSKNLLAELNYAQKLYNEYFHIDISSSDLFNMVTCNPAKALMLENEIGRIADGFSADVAIIDRKSESPYNDILSSNPENIIALFCKGTFIYGDESFFEKISIKADTEYTKFYINGRKKVIIGNPTGLLHSFVETFNIEEKVFFDFIPKDLQTV
jgi:cytosine/adenosine deaminase-related metal-dependent hydrolase